MITAFTDLTWYLCLIAHQIAADIIFFQLRAVHHPAGAGDKIKSAFQHNTYLLEIGKTEGAVTSCFYNAAGRLIANTRDTEQCIIVCTVDLDWKIFQMPDRPVTLGVEKMLKSGRSGLKSSSALNL